MAATTLTESAAEFTACAADPDDRAILARAFMAGALAALTSRASREQLLAELVQYGRAIGTAAERAAG